MSQTGAMQGGDTPAPEDPEVLRAKYLDYCSARVAERLLRLSADQIYVLAEEAVRSSEAQGRESGEFSYDTAVRLATGRIAEQLSLPPFQLWLAAYREDPSRFEAELLGLWESELAPDRNKHGG